MLHGDLSAVSVADVIQLTCKDRKTAMLIMHHDEREARVYIENGELVHAEMGSNEGEEVVFRLLAWETGEFTSEAEVPSPKVTISKSTTELLLEGARRLDEGDWGDLYDEANLKVASDEKSSGSQQEEKLHAYMEIDGVIGAICVTENGRVEEKSFDGDVERAASVVAVTGSSAGKIRRMMDFSDFSYGTIQIGERSSPLIVLPDGTHYIGLILAPDYSHTHIIAKLKREQLGIQ